jgi:dihydroneopterin aldolase/2-amino-4-hydroxy-6-hydroxymethyldihydropteridine diphosphokinase
MDQIIIENLQVFAHHGVYSEENEKGQNFYINAVLETDTRKAGILDDLSLSVDYGAVCRFLHGFLTEHTYKLIETAAERTSEALLLAFPQVRGVTLEIRKPEAPIPLTFESVSVKISRRWKKAYLGCGSNMGNRSQNLSEAVAALRLDEKCRVLRVSDWIDTTPYGGVEQRNFLNGAIAIETLYTPEELLERLHEIEKAGGRERKIHWGPRTIDLDILLYEDCIMSTDTLTIPHNDMPNRDFVLAPLAQIAPYAVHPILHQSVQQMYREVKKHGEKHYWMAEEFDAGLGI